jgi:hypothetical protein
MFKSGTSGYCYKGMALLVSLREGDQMCRQMKTRSDNDTQCLVEHVCVCNSTTVMDPLRKDMEIRFITVSNYLLIIFSSAAKLP